MGNSNISVDVRLLKDVVNRDRLSAVHSMIDPVLRRRALTYHPINLLVALVPTAWRTRVNCAPLA